MDPTSSQLRQFVPRLVSTWLPIILGPEQQVASQTTSSPSYYGSSHPATYAGYPQATHTFRNLPWQFHLLILLSLVATRIRQNPPVTVTLNSTTTLVPPTDWDWVNPDSWVDGQDGAKILASHGSTEVWKVPHTTKCQF